MADRLIVVLLAVLLVLVSVAFSASYSGYGDGVCDEKDLGLRSPDCSSEVYVVSLGGGYLVYFVVPELNVSFYTLSFQVVNRSLDKDAYVCVSVRSASGGEKKHGCFVVGPSSSKIVELPVEVSLTDSVAFGYLGDVVVCHSYGCRSVPVYIASSQYYFLFSSPHVVVSLLLLAFALFLFARYLASR